MRDLPTRVVELEKVAGSQCGIGLQQHSSDIIVCRYIRSDSFLVGHLHPGDLITAVNGVEAVSVARIAKEIKEASTVSLHVHTPHAHAETVCFIMPADGCGFTLSKDARTGLALVREITSPGANSSTRAVELVDLERGERGGLPLAPGDLLLAVHSADGTSHAVDSPKEANARLRAAAAGALVECRVLRAGSGSQPADRPTSSPKSSTRTSAIQYIEAPCLAAAKDGTRTPTEVDGSMADSSASDIGALAESLRAMRHLNFSEGGNWRRRWWHFATRR